MGHSNANVVNITSRFWSDASSIQPPTTSLDSLNVPKSYATCNLVVESETQILRKLRGDVIDDVVDLILLILDE